MLYIPEVEKLKILDLIGKLKPYGKIEITMNQNGSEISARLMNTEQIVTRVIKNE